MTEDDTPAGFYRFVPRDKNDLTEGGMLQMLAVQGQPGYDTRKHQTVGRDLRTTWVTILDPDPDLDGGGPAARVLSQGVAAGGAVFDYLEGEDFRNGAVTFASAYGGDNNHGQVWRYTPAAGRLRLLYETANRAVLDAPDNVAVSPRGGVLLCEDGYPRNFLRGLTGKRADLRLRGEPRRWRLRVLGSGVHAGRPVAGGGDPAARHHRRDHGPVGQRPALTDTSSVRRGRHDASHGRR